MKRFSAILSLFCLLTACQSNYSMDHRARSVATDRDQQKKLCSIEQEIDAIEKLFVGNRRIDEKAESLLCLRLQELFEQQCKLKWSRSYRIQQAYAATACQSDYSIDKAGAVITTSSLSSVSATVRQDRPISALQAEVGSFREKLRLIDQEIAAIGNRLSRIRYPKIDAPCYDAVIESELRLRYRLQELYKQWEELKRPRSHQTQPAASATASLSGRTLSSSTSASSATISAAASSESSSLSSTVSASSSSSSSATVLSAILSASRGSEVITASGKPVPALPTIETRSRSKSVESTHAASSIAGAFAKLSTRSAGK